MSIKLSRRIGDQTSQEVDSDSGQIISLFDSPPVEALEENIYSSSRLGDFKANRRRRLRFQSNQFNLIDSHLINRRLNDGSLINGNGFTSPSIIYPTGEI